MRQALLNETQNAIEASNPGLIHQRYLIGLDQDKEKHRAALLDHTIQCLKNEGLKQLYQSAFERWNHSFESTEISESKKLSTRGRLLIGLGSENVLEAGITLHRSYGVPLIPGTALKGLASHYCDRIWGSAETLFKRNEKHHNLLFGRTDDSGIICFHDAWLDPSCLETSLQRDVMTPHHQEWQNGGKEPSDFDSPVPVSFLTARGTFELRLSWNGPKEASKEQAETWLKLTLSLLEDALNEWGIGGKTSSGYGRMFDPESTKNSSEANKVTNSGLQKLPVSGTKVECTLLEERTKNNGWKVRHEPTGAIGSIVNNDELPDHLKTDDIIVLIVSSRNINNPSFSYPTPEVDARAMKRPRKTDPNKAKKKMH